MGSVRYLYSTSTGIFGVEVSVPVWTSTNGGPWIYRGDAFSQQMQPSWSTHHAIWAPFVRQIGAGRWVLFVSVQRADQRHVIVPAYARDPLGPFDARVTAPFPTAGSTSAYWRGSIDGSVVSWKGGLWLLWKQDIYPPTGSAVHPSLRSRQLRADGLAFAPGSTETVLLNAGPGWQAWIVEAPSMSPVTGGAVLFYSGAFFASTHYGVGWAWCPEGPQAGCVNVSNQAPLLTSGDGGWAAGGAEVAVGDPSTLAVNRWTNASTNYWPFGTATRRTWLYHVSYVVAGSTIRSVRLTPA